MKYRARLAGSATAVTAIVSISSVVLTSCSTETTSHDNAAPSSSSIATPNPALAQWHGDKPTIVLVHGAWADAAGWTPVIADLQKAGFPVKAPPNPLRGLDSDAAYLSTVLHQINGPIILVGHSYGGAVITNAAAGDPQIKALVYIAAFAPDQGDSLASLNSSTQGKEIPAVPATPSSYPQDGGGMGTELTIDPSKYPDVFLDNELPPAQQQALAVEQRPLSLAAATGVSGVPAWKTLPSWYLVADQDHAISPSLERYMATRAGAHTVDVDGPHLIMQTNPDAVVNLIEQAAVSTCQ
ncbi:alpha/beta fold hydrolase [Nocardia sp. NPDC088792]|uniref:alpha/beta fold hydrolase n=1 Tax=Nocardia sp. NPDC088792 TaxID=3364332 RepID=UPI003811A014